MTETPANAAKKYDFRKPGRLRGDAQRMIAAWQRTLCHVVVERWSQYVPVAVEWHAGGLETLLPRDALAQLPEDAIGYRLQVGDSGAAMLWAIPSRLLLAVVDGMLGGDASELPAVRELTAVEHSLAEMLVQELAEAMVEAWPGATPIACKVAKVETKPKRVRTFLNDDGVVCWHCNVAGPFGGQTVSCLISVDAAERLCPAQSGGKQQAEDKQRLTTLVQQVPVRVVARLGQATMHVSQLFELRIGDVVMLDQRLCDPIEVCVEERAKFHGWPGRIGTRQAVSMDSAPVAD